MKAAFIRRTGPPSVIEYGELPAPQLGGDDVLVRISAAAVNPVDAFVRQGMAAMALPFPFVLGRDLAGVVERNGAGAKRFKPGDRVWCNNQGIDGRQGSFAEFAAVREELLYPLPGSVDFLSVMALAHSGLTVCLGLSRIGGLSAGQTVFVSGGAGSVGRALTQVATAMGARVIASAGTERGRAACLADGAVSAIDHKSPTLEAELRAAAPEGIDVWWDISGRQDLEFALHHMCRRGCIVMMPRLDARPVLPVRQLCVNDVSILGFAINYASVTEMRAAAERINTLAAADKLRARVARTLALRDARLAHELVESKDHRLDGKIIVVPP
jgi:NADPH:quinone reductase-like Zn-dependent oxidoreductase